MIPNRWGLPDLGYGLGLRKEHYPDILDHWPAVDWFEVITENFLDTGGRPMWVLDQVAERYPIVLHGVSLNIGSTAPIDFEYLRKVKALAARVKAVWLGDHICWTGVGGVEGHDLYPLPYNPTTLRHLVERIRIVQDVLERPLVMENPSTYATFAASTIPEAEFIAELAERSDCALLLDVNNVYVCSRNHDFDARTWLPPIPLDRVVQVHLAGHTDRDTHCIDTHDDYVVPAVWDLYAELMRCAGPRSTLVEWDDEIPSFETVHAEVLKARQFRGDEATPSVEHAHG